MSTSTIVLIVVIAVAALILIGLIVGSMRKKSLADNHAQAGHLRDNADTAAAGLPDATARAERAELEAEHKRLETQRAEEQAATARTDAEQQQARHEDQIRAADRLDPKVDHKAEGYSPEVADPAGPANVSTEPDQTDATTGNTSPSTPSASTPRASATDTSERTSDGRSVDLPDGTEGGDANPDGTHRA